MIKYDKFNLTNGLTVIHHQDISTQQCVLNVLYRVGSKDENPNHTGFAHLFEHLMFGGSLNIPDFDEPLQQAGGESNAFTSNDITNYHLTLPNFNIETGFWLESDRMLQLNFNETSLKIQKSVVIEEFKERYLSQPYGDVWLHILPLAYQVHPYLWPTIGKEISHIENATLTEVQAFFNNFYAPENAILVVAGNISLEKTKALCTKWFEPIPRRKTIQSTIPMEPVQQEGRLKIIEADVPSNLIVKAYHMGGRLDKDYFACDLLSDILAGSKSSRLYQTLVKEKKIFSEFDTYISGDVDPGLFLMEGKLSKNVSLQEAENAIQFELDALVEKGIDELELARAINKTETNISFGDVNVLNRAMKLAFAEYLGDIELVNTEIAHYNAVSANSMHEMCKTLFRPENCSTLHYKSLQR